MLKELKNSPFNPLKTLGKTINSWKRRGDIEVWLSQELIENWYFERRVCDGTG